MYIKKLELFNFQVIEKFEAEFDGNVYFVTGDNELGKSTLLKAIGALLTGERDDVLRNGASKGFAKMVIGDDGEEFDVSLSFTENNPRGTLTIKQKSTGMASNNVSMLQKIFGYQDFDAVEFSRWSETAEGRRKQIAVVKALLPQKVRERIDEIDTATQLNKDQIRFVNRDVKVAETLMNESRKKIDFDPDGYREQIDVTDLLNQQAMNAQLIEKAKTVRAKLAERVHQLELIPGEIETENAKYKSDLLDIDATVAAAKAAYETALQDAAEARKEVEKMHQDELQRIEAKKIDAETRKANAEKWLSEYEANNPEKSNAADMLAKAKEHNERFDLLVKAAEAEAKYNECKAKAEKMELHIAELGKERAELIQNAELPIEGLTFTEDGLELNGVPFMPGKISDSQSMEIAAKLVIASNPTVKVFRIARGESLGQKRLETIIDIAKRNGFQGFIEQVQRGQTEMMVEEYVEG